MMIASRRVNTGWGVRHRLAIRSLAVFAVLTVAISGVSGVASAATVKTPRVAAPAATPKGTPIKIMSMCQCGGPVGSSNYPEAEIGAKAAAAAINKAGGIKGRPLELTVCEEQSNQNTASACARKAVEQKMAAVAGAGSAQGGVIMPILEAAGIPWIGFSLGSSQAELNSKFSYPLTLGGPGVSAGAAAILALYAKDKNIVTGHADVAAALGSLAFADKELAVLGRGPLRKVPITSGTPDMTAYANTVISGGTTGVFLTLGSADADRMVQAIRLAGSKALITRSATSLPPASIQTLGQNANGIMTPAFFTPISSKNAPGIKEFRRDVNGIGENPDASGEYGVVGWAAVQLFAQAAKKATTIDPAGIMAALDAGTFDLKVAPPVQFKTPSAEVGYPRVFNTSITFLQVKNGKLVSASNNQFVALFKPISKKQLQGIGAVTS